MPYSTKSKSEILQAADAVPQNDLRRKVQVLLEGVTRLAGRPGEAFDHEEKDIDLMHKTPKPSINLPSSPNDYTASDWKKSRDNNIRRFLFQSQYDSSVSDEILRDWIKSLENDIELLAVKYEHATFYSRIVTDWLSSFRDEDQQKNTPTAADEDGDAESNDSAFEEIGRAAMHEQRAIWENLVFSPADVDPQCIEMYLDRLFNRTKLSQQALKELREQKKTFGSDMKSEARNSFNISKLKTVSQSLLASDLISSEKMTILKEFLRNDEVAQEVVDVLNLRFAALDRWSWPEEGVSVEMRRQLNGKYRVFMDEDLIDAILLHYIGLQWSVTFRQAFVDFLDSPTWKSNAKPIRKVARDRRNHFLGKSSAFQTVDSLRSSMYKDHCFMSQLPSSLEEGQRAYDGW